MAENLTAGIVRILKPNGSTAGTGFIVSEGELIVTCSHVVQGEGSQRRNDPGPKYVDLIFHVTGEHRRAKVEPDWWRPANAEDVAILCLEGELPEQVKPLQLGSARGCEGHPIVSFGYPRVGDYEGFPAEGSILGKIKHPDGWNALAFRSQQISPGMSGASVLDTVTNRVVGVVSSFPAWESGQRWIAGDSYGRHTDTNFATLSETLAVLCSELELRWPAPVETYLEAIRKYVCDLPYISLAEEAPPPLETIYVRLQAQEQIDCRDDATLSGEELGGGGHRAPASPILAIDALCNHRRLAIIGPPGAGKSTFLRHLVLRLTSKEDAELGETYLPLLVSLRGLAEQKGSLLSRLREQVQVELGLRLPDLLPGDFLESWSTQTGSAWLICLDGLDEIVDENHLQGLIHQLRDAAWADGRVIVTTRPTAARILEQTPFSRFQLLPFGDTEREVFARNWFDPEEAESFLQVLSTALPEELLGIPLLLTIAAIVYQKGRIDSEAGPIRRSVLYEQFIEILLREDESPIRRMKEQLEDLFPADLGSRLFDLRRELLEEIALALQEGKAIENAVGDFLQRHNLLISSLEASKQAQRIVEILAAKRAGLVIRRGESIEFIHPTLREFLTACALLTRYKCNPSILWSKLEPVLLDEGWEEVIPLVLSRLEDATFLFGLLLEVNARDRVRQRPLFLAAAGLAEGAQGNQAVCKQVANDLEHLVRTRYLPVTLRYRSGATGTIAGDAIAALRRLRKESYACHCLLSLVNDDRLASTLRVEAAEALGELDLPRSVSVLADLARDKRVRADVRASAAEALGKLGQLDEAVSILLDLVSAGVGWAIAHALRELGCAKELLPLAKDESIAPEMRVEAAEALAGLGQPEATSLLLSLARDTEIETDLRASAAEALGELGQPEAASFLLSLASDTEVEAELRASAAGALSKLGQLDEVVPVLLDLARTAPEEAWTAYVLAELGCVEELLFLAKDRSIAPRVRVKAAEALGELGQPVAIPILSNLAKDTEVEADLRANAARALGKLGHSEEVVPVLLDVARIVSRETRTVAQTLGELGCAKELLSLAEDGSTTPEMRLRAAEALGELGRPEAVPIILSLARAWDKDMGSFSIPRVVVEALRILGCVEELLSFAKDESIAAEMRVEAVEALGELGWPEAVPVLVNLARAWDGDMGSFGIPEDVVAVLKRLGCAEELLSLSKDESIEPEMRVKAAEALGELGRPEAVPVLVNLARAWDRDMGSFGIPRDVVAALRRLGCVEELLSLAGDESIVAEMRARAAEALGELGRLDEAVSTLLGLARTAPEEAWTIAYALRELGCLEELLSLVKDESVAAGMRARAAEVLGELGRVDEAVSTLLHLARTASEEAWNIVRALRELGCVEELLSLARDESIAVGMRAEAAGSLGEFGRVDEAVSTLLGLARTVPEEAWTIAYALGELGCAEELLSLARDESIAAEMRAKAAEALGMLGRVDEAVSTLLGLARTVPEEAWTIAYALGELGCAEELLSLARDESIKPKMRVRAVEALGDLGLRDEAVSVLFDLARAVSEEARSIVYNLREWGCVEELLSLAKDGNIASEMRVEAAEVLGELGRPEAVPILLNLIRDTQLEAYLKASAAETLGKLGRSEEAVPVLIGLARAMGINDWRAWRVAYALRELGCAEVLLSLAKDESIAPRMRLGAARALGELGRSEATTILLALLQNRILTSWMESPLVWIRGQVWRTLWLLVSLAVRRRLYAQIQVEAARALIELGHAESAQPFLLDLVKDNLVEAEVREHAASMLEDLNKSPCGNSS